VSGSFGHEGDRLSAFLDDELDERAALDVARHVAGCGQCDDELEQLRATRAALRSLPPVTPPLAWMVETAVLGPGEGRPHPVATLAVGLAAMAVLLVALGFSLGGGQAGSVQPPVDRLVVDHVRSVEGGPVVTPVRLDEGAVGGG
jgi:anti-sigma factor RsiW